MIGLADSIQALRLNLNLSTGLETVYWTGSWAEFNDLDPGVNSLDIRSISGILDTITPADYVVPFPAEGRQRQVKFSSVYNPGSDPANVQFDLVIGLTTTAILVITLAVGDTLFYNDSEGWYVIDATGAIKTAVVDNTPVPAGQTTSRVLLSGSTDGRPIAVAATGTPGTLIHTAHATDIDELWLYANNRSAAAATLTIEFGGTANSDHTVEALSIPANSGPVLISDGLRLTGALVVRAFSGTANAINLSGYVDRIS